MDSRRGSDMELLDFKGPEGTSINFYIPNGGRISNELSNVIETGGDLTGLYKETYNPGEMWPNPVLKPGKDLNIKGTPITVDKPTPLSELVKPNMGSCDWAACRVNHFSPEANAGATSKGLFKTHSKDGKQIADPVEFDAEEMKSKCQKRTSDPSDDFMENL